MHFKSTPTVAEIPSQSIVAVGHGEGGGAGKDHKKAENSGGKFQGISGGEWEKNGEEGGGGKLEDKGAEGGGWAAWQVAGG